MTVNYTTNLALGQPVTGTESGTWGDDVNNAVTSYLDIAIAGGLAITVTTADVTLTITQGTSVATNIGSTTAQYAILNVSGAMTAARNLIVPSSSRQYVINNACTGGFLLTVKGSATTGVTLVNGEKAHVFWNGTDYSKLSNTPGGAGTFSSITNTGLTSGRVVFSTTAGLETDSANLTFNGTILTSTGFAGPINGTVGATTPSTGAFTSLTASTTLGVTGVSTLTAGAVVQGLTVGRGPGAVADSTVVGNQAGNSNSSGSITAIGYQALKLNVSGTYGTAVGNGAGALATGNYGLYVGHSAGASVTTGIANTFVGSPETVSGNGVGANTTGSLNTFIGAGSGYLVTSGSNNTILGAYIGNAGGLDIRTASNYIVLSDGSGNPRAYWNGANATFNGNLAVTGTLSATGVATFSAGSAAAPAITTTGDTNTGIFFPTADTIAFAEGGAEAMRIDSNGSLLVGTTTAVGRLTVTSAASQEYGTFDAPTSGYAFFRLRYNGTSYGGLGQGVAVVTGGAATDFGLNATTNMLFATGGTTEKMRLDSSGNLLVGTTSTGFTNSRSFTFQGVGDGKVYVNHSTANTSGDGFIGFGYNGTQIGSITQSGTTAVLYNVTSDYRLKIVVGAVSGQGARIDALKPIDYQWKEGNEQARGFLAHEFKTVYPNSVSGDKDAVDADSKPMYQSMQASTSEVIADLVAELQSLRARVAQLESKP